MLSTSAVVMAAQENQTLAWAEDVLSEKAIAALEDVIDSPNQAGASNKRLAASGILEHLLRLREIQSFENRISELEKLVHAKKLSQSLMELGEPIKTGTKLYIFRTC